MRLTRHLPVLCHRRHSWIGVRFWASQRLVENAFRRFVAYAQGTWLISIWLRCLGAKIGSWVTFRFCNCQVCAQQTIFNRVFMQSCFACHIIGGCHIQRSTGYLRPEECNWFHLTFSMLVQKQ